ncbi:MAG: sodium:proton antiporter NhaD [Novosphingobium sp.]|nr:sodium:proton antiporter NhaD [Novosphingobium sp.]
MYAVLICVFVLAYAAIALEEIIKVNKSATGLLGAIILWTIYSLSMGEAFPVDEKLNESLIDTAQIVFFLIGAMTVVEVVDSHDGFEVITSRIRARSMVALIWIIAGVTFFLSAILDNLTTTIVMVSLCRKLVEDRNDRLMLAGIVVIAANAGGAWSPIGDVTTTMLWIGGEVTTIPIMTGLFLPSLVNMMVPLAAVSLMMRGRKFELASMATGESAKITTDMERNVVFFVGLAALVSVPMFKAITHLPPFMGILLGLGILWLVADLIHRDKPYEERETMTIANALARIDMSAIVFFIGILLAVAVLSHSGILSALAAWLDETVGRLDVIVLIIGLVSAVVDNVPMVAAAMGMYGMDQYPADSFLWEFMAYCAGTGGSILIIGSAAGVAAMGIEKIDFLWYLRKFSWLALLGYFAGALVYIVEKEVMF